MAEEICCLLIGNTRWHWAIQEKEKEKWNFFHTLPNEKSFLSTKFLFFKWASVGKVPKAKLLNPNDQFLLNEIPLLNLPKWIGIDRALGGWGAFNKARSMNLHSKGILIADAGTVLSLTRITAKGEFNGGQLVPGLNLQRSLIASGTKSLKKPIKQSLPVSKFPFETEGAILRGTFQSLIGTILEAQMDSNMPLWLCGGDSEKIYEVIKNRKIDVTYSPNLVLEGMINLIKTDLIKS